MRAAQGGVLRLGDAHLQVHGVAQTNAFGPLQNSIYDAGTLVATALQQGATNIRVVRATDGTDTDSRTA